MLLTVLKTVESTHFLTVYMPLTLVIASLLLILGLQPRDMAAMLVVKTIKIISNNLHENGI